MALTKLYDRINWADNTAPDINASNLNRMSKALDDLDDRVILIAGDVLVTVPQLREMLEDCTELEARLEAMTENPPYIGENGHWYIWDTDTGAYVDSGIDASITVEIADITMLDPSATPYVTNTGTDTDPIFHLYIPRGQSGKGISSIAKTSTSGYVDTYTITYTDGTTTTYTVTNGRNTDQVTSLPTAAASLVGTIYQYIGASTSSYTHGFYYECVNDGGVYKWVNIPVGNDPVEVSNSDPYIYRQGKGYLADIEIEGASVGWNQLVQNSGSDLSVTIPSGRKYIMKKNGTYTVGQSDGTALTGLTGGTDNVHDLSPMFNSTVADAIYAMEQATAGAGVAFFRKYFPKDYYAYDAGSTQSVCIASRKVVGKNLFDPSQLLAADGATYNGEIYTFSKDKMTPLYGKSAGGFYPRKYAPNTQYTFSVYGYNSRSNFSIYILHTDGTQKSNSNTSTTDFTKLTITSDAGKTVEMIFFSYASYGTTYWKEPQLEIGSTATIYEPYTSTAYPFDSTKQLRGMFNLVNGELKANGDVWRGDKIQRNWVDPIDLGELTYTYTSSTLRFYATLPTKAKTYVSVSNYAQAICSKKYTISPLAYSDSDRTDLTLMCTGNRVYIRDAAYTDAATFKTAMSGIYLTYEADTPTTEAAQPYQNPQRAYIDGTEEFIDGLTRDVMIPVGNNSVYQQDKVLPSVEDYVDAVAEQKADISAIGTNEDKATASQAYTVGQHFYKDGKFCTAIANIASGGTFTLNTNYVEGTIAEALEAINVSGGHTIVNSSGTEMASRSKLKFANATVTDDSANDQTVITTNPASAEQTATLATENFIKDSSNSGVYYITRSGFCEVHIKTIKPKNAGQGLLVATGLPLGAFDGIIMGNTPYFEDGTAFYINTTNNTTSLYALIPDTGVKSGCVLYMMK